MAFQNYSRAFVLLKENILIKDYGYFTDLVLYLSYDTEHITQKKINRVKRALATCKFQYSDLIEVLPNFDLEFKEYLSGYSKFMDYKKIYEPEKMNFILDGFNEKLLLRIIRMNTIRLHDETIIHVIKRIIKYCKKENINKISIFFSDFCIKQDILNKFYDDGNDIGDLISYIDIDYSISFYWDRLYPEITKSILKMDLDSFLLKCNYLSILKRNTENESIEIILNFLYANVNEIIIRFIESLEYSKSKTFRVVDFITLLGEKFGYDQLKNKVNPEVDFALLKHIGKIYDLIFMEDYKIDSGIDWVNLIKKRNLN